MALFFKSRALKEVPRKKTIGKTIYNLFRFENHHMDKLKQSISFCCPIIYSVKRVNSSDESAVVSRF